MSAALTVLGLLVVLVITHEVGVYRGFQKAKRIYGPGADFWYERSEEYRKLAIKAIDAGFRNPPRQHDLPEPLI